MCRSQFTSWRSGVAGAILACCSLLLFLDYSAGQNGPNVKPAPAQPAERKVYVIPNGRWGDVIDWLSDISDLPMLTTSFPPGSLRLRPSFDMPTTIDDVFAVLNEALAEQQQMLIRRETAITLWNTEESVPPEILPYSNAEDWDDAPPSKLVKTKVQLGKLKFETASVAVKKVLGRFGQALPGPAKDELLLIDSVANVRAALTVLQKSGANMPEIVIPSDSWKDTLDWLSARTKLPAAGKVLSVKPLPGPLSVGPLTKVNEIIDLLNGLLAKQNLLIFRGGKALNVVPANAAIDSSLVSSVRVADLDRCGKTEVVSVVVTPKGETAAEKLPAVKKMLTRFGTARDTPGNQLVIQDTAGNLRVVVDMVRGVVAQKAVPQSGKKKIYTIPEDSWEKVLEWLSDTAELPILSLVRPNGRFRMPTVYDPPKESLTSIAEVVEFLNSAIAEQEFMIILRQSVIAIWPKEELHFLYYEGTRGVEIADLESLDSKRHVRINVQLTDQNAEKVAPAVKKMLSPFGFVIPLEKANQLRIIDSVDSLRRVTKLLLDPHVKAAKLPIPRDSWKSTLDWLSLRLSMPFTGKLMPTTPLRGGMPAADAFVTSNEIIDLLNASLLEQKLILIRGKHALTVVWTDEAIDPSLVPRVRLRDLKDLGKTEVVSLIVELNGIKAADQVAGVKKLLSPFGTVSEAAGNQLVLQDMAEKLRVVVNALSAIGAKAGA